MAYLHCHNCRWEQDDFWDDWWNPIKGVESWEKDFLSGGFRQKFTTDPEFIRTYGDITLQEVLALEFEKGARKIRNMVYRTEKELKEMNPDYICPKCGKQELDID